MFSEILLNKEAVTPSCDGLTHRSTFRVWVLLSEGSGQALDDFRVDAVGFPD